MGTFVSGIDICVRPKYPETYYMASTTYIGDMVGVASYSGTTDEPRRCAYCGTLRQHERFAIETKCPSCGAPF